MEMTNSYIVDHLSVLMVKKDFDMKVDEELKEFEKLMAEIISQNPDKAAELWTTLGSIYAYNRLMFPIHDKLMGTNDTEFIPDDQEFRYLTETLLELNGERVKARSEIAKMFDEPTEYKTYA